MSASLEKEMLPWTWSIRFDGCTFSCTLESSAVACGRVALGEFERAWCSERSDSSAAAGTRHFLADFLLVAFGLVFSFSCCIIKARADFWSGSLRVIGCPNTAAFSDWFTSILKTACVQHAARFARSSKTKPLEMARISSLTGQSPNFSDETRMCSELFLTKDS